MSLPDKDLELSVGGVRLLVPMTKLTPPKGRALVAKLAELKAKNSEFMEYPIKEKETIDEWYERIGPDLLKDKTLRRKGESTEDYLKRIYTQKTDKFQLVYEVLKFIAELFEQPESVTPALFDNTPYAYSKKFIRDVLDALELGSEDFE